MQKTLIVIGPSASGKSTVVRALERRGMVRVLPTWTTRPPRPDERDGALEHRFVTEAEFDELWGAGFFLGTVRLPGLQYRYGLPHLRLPDGPTDVVGTILARAPFLEALKAFVPSALVYQIEDTTSRARLRLLERGCDENELRARLDCNAEETAAGRAIADRVFTNDATIVDLVDNVAAALRNDLAATVGLVRS